MDFGLDKLVLLNPLGLIELSLLGILLCLFLYSLIAFQRGLSFMPRLGLILLRVCVFFTLCVILLNPASRRGEYVEEKPRLAVLLDTSWSMNLPSGREGVSRRDAAREFLSGQKGFWSKLKENYEMNFYRFDGELRVSTLGSLVEAEPTGASTDVQGVLAALMELEQGVRPSSVLFLTDGFGGDPASPEALESKLRSADITMSVVSALGEGEITDVWIDKIHAPGVAFLRRSTKVDIEIRTSGLGIHKIPVTLAENGEALSVSAAEPSVSGESYKVSLDFVPNETGRKVYTVSIPNIAGDQIEINNSRSFVVDVVIDRVRVLHIAGAPSWDVKFLRKVLKRNPGIDLVSFFILRDRADYSFAPQDELSLIPFPINDLFGKDLETFDLVIFQDFAPTLFGFSRRHLRNLRDFVKRDGRGFLLVGGQKSFAGGRYGISSISEILPIDIVSLKSSERPTGVRLTSEGAWHPVTQMSGNRSRKTELWTELPHLDGFFKGSRPKADSSVLLETQSGEPLVVLGEYGRGRSAVFLADSSWRWGFLPSTSGEVGAVFNRFWNKVILWLVDDPELKETFIATSGTSFDVGEKGEIDIISLGSLGSRGAERDFKLFLRKPAGNPNVNPEPLEMVYESGGMYSAEQVLEDIGVYGIELFEGEGNNKLDESLLLVSPPAGEIKGSNSKNLARVIAQVTGGGHITAWGDTDKLGIDFKKITTLVGYKTKPLWDRAWVFALLIGFVTLEIFLRRRLGLK